MREQVNHTRTAREMADLLRAYLGDLAAQGLEAFAPEGPPGAGNPPKAGPAAMESLGATG